MTGIVRSFLTRTVKTILVCGALTAVAKGDDLSRYREFQLGSDLTTVARQSGAVPTDAKIVHSRPALIQELEWRPQPLGPSLESESAKRVIFHFYNDQLFRIVVDYDQYQTSGLTVDDLVEAMSRRYGVPSRLSPPTPSAEQAYSGDEQIVARWQDAQYRFDLIRSSYGPTFKLVGLLKRLEVPSGAAITEAQRLDVNEEPQREAERAAREAEAEQAKQQKARVVNKPKFRP